MNSGVLCLMNEKSSTQERMCLRCHREAKKSKVSPVMQEAAKRVAGKSEVRNKSQSKAKQEESSEGLSSNCGGRKGMDSIAVFMLSLIHI